MQVAKHAYLHLCGQEAVNFLPWPNLSVCTKVRQMAQFHKPTNQCAQQSAWVIFSNSNVLFVLRQHTKRTWFFDCCDSIFYTIKVTFDLQQVNTSSAEGPHLPIGGVRLCSVEILLSAKSYTFWSYNFLCQFVGHYGSYWYNVGIPVKRSGFGRQSLFLARFFRSVGRSGRSFGRVGDWWSRVPRRIAQYPWGDRGLVSLSYHASADCYFPPWRRCCLSRREFYFRVESTRSGKGCPRHSPSRGSVCGIWRSLGGRLPDLLPPKMVKR